MVKASHPRVLELLENSWLTDIDINNYLNKLKEKFGKHFGLEDPLIIANFIENIPKKRAFIRVVHCGENNHWVCISSSKGTKSITCLATLYDSYHRMDITGELARVLAETIDKKDTNQSSIVRWADTQLQTGKWQCGYFSLANATALCYKQDPETMVFDENQIRQHYINIMFNNFPLTMFPFHLKKKSFTERYLTVFNE
jgi:hypothetical protein